MKTKSDIFKEVLKELKREKYGYISDYSVSRKDEEAKRILVDQIIEIYQEKYEDAL